MNSPVILSRTNVTTAERIRLVTKLGEMIQAAWEYIGPLPSSTFSTLVIPRLLSALKLPPELCCHPCFHDTEWPPCVAQAYCDICQFPICDTQEHNVWFKRTNPTHNFVSCHTECTVWIGASARLNEKRKLIVIQLAMWLSQPVSVPEDPCLITVGPQT